MNLTQEHWQSSVQFLKKLRSCNMDSLNTELTKVLEDLFSTEVKVYIYNTKWASLYDLNVKRNCLESTHLPFISILQNSEKIETTFIPNHPWIFYEINTNEILVIYFDSIFTDVNIDKLLFYLISWSNTKKQLEWKSKNKRLKESLSLIRKIAKDLSQSYNLRNLFKNILDVAIDLVQAEKGHILRYNKETNELIMEVVRGMASPEIDDKINNGEIPMAGITPGEGIQGKVFLENESIKIDIPELGHSGEEELHSLLCVPLSLNNEVNGILYVTNKVGHLPFEQDDLDLLEILASNAASLIRQEELKKISITDPLTKLYTRRYFEPHLLKEVRRSRRYSKELSIVGIDADRFKRVNDSYGHQAGDKVLEKIADVILSCIRKDVDIPARFGGEEFFILLPETDEDGAIMLAERIRQRMEATTIDWEGQKINITLSLGISIFPNHAHTPIDLIKFADEALYQSKTNGRNLVSVYKK